MLNYIVLFCLVTFTLGQYNAAPGYSQNGRQQGPQYNAQGPLYQQGSQYNGPQYVQGHQYNGGSQESGYSQERYSSGNTVTYNFELDWCMGSPDGFERRVICINGQFPGPTIEAHDGDTVRINMTNHLDRSMAIHWHGIYQAGTPDMDGAAFIGECPTLPGSSKIYEFYLNQYGTYWYHSHFMNEIVDGCKGAFIIHRRPGQPEPYEYDKEVVLQVTDWYHTLADILWRGIIDPAPGVVVTGPPTPDSVLINGIGQPAQCDWNDNCQYAVLEASIHGYTRFRLISVSAYLPIIVSIDDHVLIITEVDGIDVAWQNDGPEELKKGTYSGYVSHIRINVAQRYSFIAVPINGVKPKAGDKFWVRAVLDNGQYAGGATSGLGGSSPTYGGYDGAFANAAAAQLNSHRQFNKHRGPDNNRHETGMPGFNAYHGPDNQGPSYTVPHQKRSAQQGTGGASTYAAPTSNVGAANAAASPKGGAAPAANATAPPKAPGVLIALAVLVYGDCAGLPDSNDHGYGDALTLSSLPCPECVACDDLHPLEDLSPPQPTMSITLNIEFFLDPNGGIAHINNVSCTLDTWGSNAIDIIRYGSNIPASCLSYDVDAGDVVVIIVNNREDGEHPMHLHGHTFWVLSQGDVDAGVWDRHNRSQPAWNFKNPLFRDTVTVNPNSYVIILFVANNWGPWIMHCHIDWHMMAGLALVVNEEPDQTKKIMGPVEYPVFCPYVAPPLGDATIHNLANTYAAGPINYWASNSFPSLSIRNPYYHGSQEAFGSGQNSYLPGNGGVQTRTPYNQNGPQYNQNGPQYNGNGPQYNQNGPQYNGNGPQYNGNGPQYNGPSQNGPYQQQQYHGK